MFKNTDFISREMKDFAPIFYRVNPTVSPYLTYLLAKGRTTKATDVTVARKILDLTTGEINKSVAEGADWTENAITKPSYVTNNTELFTTMIKVSDTASAIANANGSSPLKDEVIKKNILFKKYIDCAILTGEKADSPMSMAGAKNLADVITYSGNLYTKTNIDAAMLKLYNNGYAQDVVIVINPGDKPSLDKIFKEDYTQNLNNGTDKIGIAIFNYLTVYGFYTKILLDPNMPAGEMLINDISGTELPVLIPLTKKELYANGSYSGIAEETQLTYITSTKNTIWIKKADTETA